MRISAKDIRITKIGKDRYRAEVNSSLYPHAPSCTFTAHEGDLVPIKQKVAECLDASLDRLLADIDKAFRAIVLENKIPPALWDEATDLYCAMEAGEMSLPCFEAGMKALAGGLN